MKHGIRLDKSVNEKIDHGLHSSVALFIKREDAIHSKISGNKYRKLKYNLESAKQEGVNTLLTFGGAFSNHIAAVASVGKTFGFNTIGVIRGEELTEQANDTLQFASDCGMQLKFIDRETYKEKHTRAFLKQLKDTFGEFYEIPEGGTNALAIKGCEEILTEADSKFDYICCSVGTGGTISGLINSANSNQKILGFPALKGDFLDDEIRKFVQQDHWELIKGYHFGGYAKINSELITFMNTFRKHHGILLDPIYTGKMMFGLFDLIKANYFEDNTRILAIHTGGLQGISGMNHILKGKHLPLINHNED